MPIGSTTVRRHAKLALAAFIAGLVAVSSAFAGIVLSPQTRTPGLPKAPEVARAAGVPLRSASASSVELDPDDVAAIVGSDVKAPQGGRTPAGTFLVGAARVSLEPSPTLFGGETWQREGCTAIEDGNVNADHVIPPVDDPVRTVDEIRGWPASSPDCVYLGGFGIGPYRAAKRVGAGGVWMRAIAISNGEETFVYEIADLVGWFARYDPTICTDCGIRDVRGRLAKELGVEMSDIVAASTHSHATADTYGGWGGIPDWYRNQIRDSAVAAAKQAVANLAPGTVSTGEVHLRNRNEERRDHYYSTVDTGATWLQAKTLPGAEQGCEQTTTGQARRRTPERAPTPTPCVPTQAPSEVVATMATYAAHPVIVDDPILHADWPGATARRLEALYGGVGLTFEGGLGNVSPRGPGGATDEEEAEATGRAIAEDVAASIADDTHVIASNDMKASVQDIAHPAMSNPGLVTLGAVGLFDREFIPGTPGAGPPGAYHWSKSGEASTSGDASVKPEPGSLRGCTTAGPTVITTAGAHRIGDLLVAFAPGEIFSNIAEVVKERADANEVAMVLGQSNDALGYIIQSFEFDSAANVVTEYGTQTGEYEEIFAIDRCFGDHVLETMLESTRSLGFDG